MNYDNPNYIRPARIRAFAKRHGRRVSRDFIALLERSIEDALLRALNDTTTTKVTLDAQAALRALSR
jgi:hypothetical protein